MLSAIWKKLSQASATAALGFAMLAAISTNPAQAANLKTFNLTGNFASEALEDSTGLALDLAGGSLSGTYTVDVDELLAFNSAGLTSWTVNLLNSANNVVVTLSNSLPNNIAYIEENALFFEDASFLTDGSNYYGLELYFDDNFTGTGTSNDGSFIAFSDLLSDEPKIGIISITNAQSEPVPEPLTLGATAVAGGIGLWMKRKQKASTAA